MLARAVQRRALARSPRLSPAGPHQGALLQREPATIVQSGEMSGDSFGVAVAMMSDPELSLILVTARVPRGIADPGNLPLAGPRDQGDWIYDFYRRDSGIDPARIQVVLDRDPAKHTKHLLRTYATPNTDPFFGKQIFSVGAATNVLRARFSEQLRISEGAPKLTEQVREAWRKTSGVTTEELDEIIQRRGIPALKPVVVLWSRQSGAQGGLHPELDSSYTGIAQLTERFTAAGHVVIIVGDDPLKNPLDPASSKIVGTGLSEHNRGAYEKAVRLGAFWKTDLVSKPRTAQFAFFDRVRERATKLTHIGMRSGNLEAYAYMGHRVLFLEEREKTDAMRMDKLVAINRVLKFRTYKLTSLPTRTGRMLVGAPRGEMPAVDTASRNPKLNKPTKFTTLAALDKGVKDTEEGATHLAELKQTPGHQQVLVSYRFHKRRDPRILPAAGEKGFSDSDLDAIVNATTTTFRTVVLLKDDLDTFIPIDDSTKLVEGERYTARDKKEYTLAKVVPTTKGERYEFTRAD